MGSNGDSVNLARRLLIAGWGVTSLLVTGDARAEAQAEQVAQVLIGDQVCAASAASTVRLTDVLTLALQEQPQLLIAKEAAAKARANLLAARSPFLPNVTLSFQSERFVPSTISQPITVGNTVVGGSFETKTSYGSIGLNWNLYSGGRDTAALHAAQSDVKANEAGIDHQLDETLMTILTVYMDVYKAQQEAASQRRILSLQQSMEQRAEQQYRQGTATTLAIAQAQTSVLQTRQQLYQACRTVADKAAALAQSVGLHLGPDELYQVDDLLPGPIDRRLSTSDWQEMIRDDPAVIEAQANVTTAEYKLKQTYAGYGPTLSLEGRKDYLGQDRESWRAANHITPNSYRIGLQIQQPIAPLTSEYAAVQGAKSDLRKAQATYQQTLLETEAKYHSAFNALRAASASLSAEKQSLAQAQQLLTLTQSLLASGRVDQDKVQQAQIGVEKAINAVEQASAEESVANWLVLRVSEPRGFPDRVVRQLVPN